MKTRHFSNALFSLALASSSTAFSQLLPSRTVTFDASLKSFQSPRWENGYLLFKGLPFTKAGTNTANVAILDSQGRSLPMTRFWLTGASEVTVMDVAASNNGKIAVSAHATRSDGTVAYVISILDVQGKMDRVIQTNPVAASHLRFGPDGSLWVFGIDRNSVEKKRSPIDTVYHFSSEGTLISSTLPTDHPDSGGMIRPYRHGGKFGRYDIGCSSLFTWVYAADSNEWVEISSGNKQNVVRFSPVRAYDDQQVDGIVVSPSGLVIAELSGAVSGLYQLDKNSGRWESLIEWSRKDGNQPFGKLYGIDGEYLVFSSSSLDSAYSWYSLKDVLSQKSMHIALSTNTVASQLINALN